MIMIRNGPKGAGRENPKQRRAKSREPRPVRVSDFKHELLVFCCVLARMLNERKEKRDQPLHNCGDYYY